MTRQEVDDALGRYFDTGCSGNEDANLYLIPYCSHRSLEHSYIQVYEHGVVIDFFRGRIELAYDEITDIDIFLDEIQPAERMPGGIRYQAGNVSFVTTYGEITVWVQRHEVHDRFFDRKDEERGWF